MNPVNHTHVIVAFCCLAITGAFSLLGMRYATSRQALQVKALEQELQKLQTLDKRMDIYLAHRRHQQRALYAKCPAQRMVWIRTDNRLPVTTALAYNR